MDVRQWQVKLCASSIFGSESTLQRLVILIYSQTNVMPFCRIHNNIIRSFLLTTELSRYQAASNSQISILGAGPSMTCGTIVKAILLSHATDFISFHTVKLFVTCLSDLVSSWKPPLLLSNHRNALHSPAKCRLGQIPLRGL